MAEVVPIPVLHDNYAYLLIDHSQGIAAAIDPVEPETVLAAAAAHKVHIRMVLTTHAHIDHAGGNEQIHALLIQREKVNVPVIGGREDHVPGATQEVGHGEMLHLGALSIRVLHTPCHTRGHVLYQCENNLFTGDTLFVAGCGRFFNGTPGEMHHALNTVVASLPPSTAIYCGHEYTTSNLRFAAHVEPENEAVQQKLKWAQQCDELQRPTIPSTIQDERQTNPFMRVDRPDVMKFTGHTDPVDVMEALRTAKNEF